MKIDITKRLASKHLLATNIQETTGSYKSCDIECIECKTKWKASYTSGISCNVCSIPKDKMNTEHSLYLIVIDNRYLGFGESKNPITRMSAHSKSITDSGMSMVAVGYYEMTYKEAKMLEYNLRFDYPIVNLGINGFKRECTHLVHLSSIINDIQRNSISQYHIINS